MRKALAGHEHVDPEGGIHTTLWTLKGVNPMERKRVTDFDPQLLALFDKYVHGHISRREFLDGASRFAVVMG